MHDRKQRPRHVGAIGVGRTCHLGPSSLHKVHGIRGLHLDLQLWLRNSNDHNNGHNHGHQHQQDHKNHKNPQKTQRPDVAQMRDCRECVSAQCAIALASSMLSGLSVLVLRPQNLLTDMGIFRRKRLNRLGGAVLARLLQNAGLFPRSYQGSKGVSQRATFLWRRIYMCSLPGGSTWQAHLTLPNQCFRQPNAPGGHACYCRTTERAWRARLTSPACLVRLASAPGRRGLRCWTRVLRLLSAPGGCGQRCRTHLVGVLNIAGPVPSVY